MDIYEQIVNCFLEIPSTSEWEELRVLFQRLASKKPRHWTLPVQACEAVGASIEQSIPAATAIACGHISIILVDDMLDSDPRGEYRLIGMPVTANMACAFQAAGLDVLARCKSGAGVKLMALENINRMFLTTSMGQLWDLNNPLDETEYWRIVRTKSSPFFGTALQIGALLGNASLDIVEKLRTLGCLYGEMIQIHDDLNDVMAVPANPDWTESRSPLPILFAFLVDHPERVKFQELRQTAGNDPKSLEEAQEILIRCGAVSYCVDQILRRYQSTQEILASVTLIRRDAVDTLFEEIIEPILKLFESLSEIPNE